MAEWLVTPEAANPSKGRLTGQGLDLECALGKSGVIDAALKKEGDGYTPLGRYPFRRLFYRADRLDKPQCIIEGRIIQQMDAWCDAPEHESYNYLVELPFSSSHEKLWRDDHVYDLIMEIGHNDAPPTPGLGSAIFMHVARENYEPTEGCIALSLQDMLSFLSTLKQSDFLKVG